MGDGAGPWSHDHTPPAVYSLNAKSLRKYIGRWATMQHECMTSHGRLAEKATAARSSRAQSTPTSRPRAVQGCLTQGVPGVLCAPETSNILVHPKNPKTPVGKYNAPHDMQYPPGVRWETLKPLFVEDPHIFGPSPDRKSAIGNVPALAPGTLAPL
jgi:hypothetical protein